MPVSKTSLSDGLWNPIYGIVVAQKVVAHPLFDCAVEVCKKQGKKAYYITCDGYVTLTDGTGVVHIAPAFGEDDANGISLFFIIFCLCFLTKFSKHCIYSIKGLRLSRIARAAERLFQAPR